MIYYYHMISAAITLFAGMLFFIFAGSFKKSGLYIPAGVLSSTGGIQMYVSSTGVYASWIYLWPLIFVGLGMGFILFDSYSKRGILTWLGSLWCGLGFVFTAIGYTLYHINPIIFSWPMVIIGTGLMFLLPGLPGKLRAFRIPGIFITGLGALLMVQWITQNWQSWTYVWAILPALVGLGIISISKDNSTKVLTAGNIIVGVSSIFFLIFAAVFSGYWHIVRYWPLILIILGLWQFFHHRDKSTFPAENWNHKKQEALE